MATVLRWPIESIGFLFSFLLDARTATDRIFEVFDETNTITDPENPLHDRASPAVSWCSRTRTSGIRMPVPASAICSTASTWCCARARRWRSSGLTGCGKTTLTTLPTRLYDVTGGRVLLDGVDVRDLKLSELRRHIAMAFEDATLFSSTVRQNVLLGRADLDIHSPEAERVLREALDIAQAGFVDDLPDGAETMIGEEGMSLSGGQRQRLALARAVAAKPSVLVLDDPLSALDVDTEALVEEALRRILADTTALVVAHRPSTVALADRVALHGGRPHHRGRHALRAAAQQRPLPTRDLEPRGRGCPACPSTAQEPGR